MKYLIQNKNWDIVGDYNLEKLLYLLIDRPSYINQFDDLIWKNSKDQEHRNYDLPALATFMQYIEWRTDDLLHRNNNKPAIIYSSGYKEYWSNGMQLNK